MRKIADWAGRYLLNAGVGKEEYRQIQRDVCISNRQNLMIFSALATAFLLFMFCLSFAVETVEENRLAYLAAMFVMLGLFAAAKFFGVRYPWLLLAGMYLFMGILCGFGIVVGTALQHDEYAVSFIALLLTVPQLFTDRPVRMICNIYGYVLVFVTAAGYFKTERVLGMDVLNALVFGTISAVVSTYMMSVKCQRHLFERRAVILSETDLLTGLRNRNSYEKNLGQYPSRCGRSLSCVFVDINGLHEWNNARGHESGDEMIRFIAEAVREQFGHEDAYRIGGDEFVAFAPDCGPRELEEKVRAVVRVVEAKGYCVAVGYDTRACSGLDMAGLVQNAEKRMYEDKESFYAQREIRRAARG